MVNEQNLNEDVNDQSNAQNATGANSNENQNNNQDDVNNQTNGTNNQSSDKTFTQSQVSQMMANEKRQGREAAYRDLGIDPKDEKQIAMFKAFMEAQNANVPTEEQIAKSEAKFVEAEQRAREAEVKVELMKLGASPKYIDDIVTLASTKIGGSEDIDLKSVVNEYKSKYPIWFTEEDAQNSTGSKGTGSSMSNTSTSSSNGNKQSIGSRLAAQKRENNNIKSSFWK